MRFPAAIYHGNAGREYLAVYNHWPDISVKLHSLVRGGEHLAHLAYAKGGRESGIDIFFFREGVPNISWMLDTKKNVSIYDGSVIIQDSKKRRRIERTSLRDANRKYAVHTEMVPSQPSLEEEIMLLARADVAAFCGDKAAKYPGSEFLHVKRIAPVTEIRRIGPNKNGLIEGGKQWYVGVCRLVGNIDFAKGCISGWIPGDGASFSSSMFHNYFLYPWGECVYCYAKDKHLGFPKQIIKFEKKQLLEELSGKAKLIFGSKQEYGRKIEILRLGKRTEAGSQFTLDSLALTLEACAEVGTRGVMPTKFLKFDREIAELMRRTDTSVLYSLGYDEVEQGAVMHGCTNEFRLEQAIKYHEAGVNSAFYLLIIAHRDPGARELQVLELAEKKGMHVQVLPMRFKSKALARHITGTSWSILKGERQHGIPGLVDETGGYKVNSGMLIAQRIHPEWKKILGDNNGRVRMCHHDDIETYCGSCFLGNGCITETIEIAEKRPRPRTGRRKKKKAVERTGNLFI